MNKTLTLLTASLIALYGCGGGGSSSGSTSNQKGPSNQADFPIKNALFAPKPSTILNYVFEADKQDEISITYQPLSYQEVVEMLQNDTDSYEMLSIVHDLNNNGVDKFYLSEQVRKNMFDEGDHTLYFAGNDGSLHEITDAYFISSGDITKIMKSSPLFRLKGTDVKESNPILDISEETISMKITLDGEAVANLLSDFEDYPWVENLPSNASCQVNWQQEINETGVRKSFIVSGKSIEAANLSEKNTYYIGCEGMDSTEFGTSSERWFNPTIGLIEQVELMSVEQATIEESAAKLTAIKKV